MVLDSVVTAFGAHGVTVDLPSVALEIPEDRRTEAY